jgi:hypothetical protein
MVPPSKPGNPSESAKPTSRDDEDMSTSTKSRTVADEVRLRFDRELWALTPSRRENTVALIAALTLVESWEQIRRTHDHSPVQTRQACAGGIDRLLPST